MTTQLDFLSRLPAGSQPNECSEAAAESQTPDRLARLRFLVLAYMVSRGAEGATADEVESHFRLGHNTTSPRVTELHSMGYLVRCDGRERAKCKRPTRKGSPAFVYLASASGRALVAEMRDGMEKVS